MIENNYKYFRYEKKFKLNKNSQNLVIDFLFRNNLRLTEHNKERKINSIYFDTLNFKHLKDNINGLNSRKKFRIRWYGFNNQNEPNKANLEIKIKKGLLGKKLIFPLKIFKINSQGNFTYSLDLANTDKAILHEFNSLRPNLMVT